MIFQRNKKRFRAAAAALMASTCIAPLTAHAHTDSLGFIISPNSTSGLFNAEIFYGSWHNGVGAAEGSLVLRFDDGSVSGSVFGTSPFALVSGFNGVSNGVMPAGLTPGLNYFVPDSSTPEVDLSGDVGAHGIYAFQSAIFAGLTPGRYMFGYSAGSLSANWTPADPAINAGAFTIGANGSLVVDGAGPGTPNIEAGHTYSPQDLRDADANPVFDGGVLQANVSETLALDFTIASTGAVDTGSYELTLTGDIGGEGSLEKVGEGALILLGANTYTGDTNVSQGLLKLGATGALENSVLQVQGTFDISDSSGASVKALMGDGVVLLGDKSLTITNARGAFGGSIGGSGSLTIADGEQTLTGANTFTGGVNITGGGLGVSSDNSLGSGPLTIGAGLLRIDADIQTQRSVNLTSQAAMIDTAGNSLTLSGAISGPGTLNKLGDGTLTLTGANSFVGLNLRGGTLAIGSDAALGHTDGIISISEDTTLKTLGAFTINHTLQVDNTLRAAFDTSGHDVVMAGNITGAGAIRKIGGGVLTLTGTNTQVEIEVLGGKVIAASQAAVGAAGGVIFLRDGGGFTAGSNMNVTQQVNVTGENATFDTGANTVTLSGAVTGDRCFNKVGSGHLVLASNGSNAIGACVQQGAMTFNSTFTGRVWVEETAVIGGGGQILGDVEVRGTVSPGNSPGQLTVAGSVEQLAGSTLSLDIDGPTAGVGAGHYDTLVLAGTGSVYTAGGTIAPVLRGITGSATNAYTPRIGDTFQVVTASGGVVGSFAALAQPTAGLAPNTRIDVRYRPNAVVLAVTPDRFEVFGQTGNAARLGGAVDSLRGPAGVRDASEAGALVDGLIGLDAAALSRAMQQASGEVHADAMDATLRGKRGLRGLVSQHLNDGFGHGKAAGEQGRHGWGTIAQDDGVLSGDAFSDRYQASTTHIVVGVDAQVSPTLTIGGAAAYSDVAVRTARVGQADADSYAGVAYAHWNSQSAYLSGLAAFGVDRYKIARTVDLSTGAEDLFSDSDGASWSAEIEGGAPLTFGAAILTPAVGVAYDSVRRDGLVEQGSASVALGFADENRSAWSARVGARLTTIVRTGGLELRPYASAFVTRELEERATQLDARLHGESVQVRAAAADRNGLDLATGLEADLGPRARLHLGYRHTDADGATSHAFTGGAVLRW